MKTIYAIRHAKSSWADSSLTDEKRPLNERGKRSAPLMAEMMTLKETRPDVLITSTAKRARSTARRFRDVYGLSKDLVFKDGRLYLATPDEILSVLRELPEDYRTVAFFGHNPGITDFANLFAEDYIENVPTCGVVKLVSTAEHWYDLNTLNTQRTAFYYPKQFGY